MTDAYSWVARYQDGAELHEQDATQGFASVDQSRVKSLLLLRGGVPLHQVDIPEGAQCVFFRRRQVALALDGSEADRISIHCIGWVRNEDAAYLFIGDDGRALLSSDLQAV